MQTRWCVGLTIDPKFGHIYWTQKGPDNAGLGRIFRANVEIPAGQTAATRSDIEIFYDGLPEPIDLELDHKNRVLYWTDRGDPPRGNTVNRASIDNKPAEPEIVVTHLMEGIGIALDIPNDRMFVTDFAGSIYSARLDGSGERNFLYAQGNLTGIAYAEIHERRSDMIANQAHSPHRHHRHRRDRRELEPRCFSPRDCRSSRRTSRRTRKPR